MSTVATVGANGATPSPSLSTCISIGPLSLQLKAPQVFKAAVDSLLEDYEGAPLDEEQLLTVPIRLEWAANNTLPVDDEGLRFPQHPEGGWVDHCPGWHARLHLNEAGQPELYAQVSADAKRPEERRAILVTLVRVASSVGVVSEKALLLHGCAMVHPSHAFAVAFLGPSGSGKTTMSTRLPGWKLLADDTIVVQHRGTQHMVAGTPLPGHEGLARCGRWYPLRAVYMLEPGATRARSEPLSQDRSYEALLERVMWYVEGGTPVERVLELIEQIVTLVPCARLHSSLNDDVEDLVTSRPPRAA